MRQDIPQRIIDKIDATGDCWEWTAYRNAAGYGEVCWGGKQIKRPAHRVVWSILVGEIAEGSEIDHLCRNRGCVNPDHLELTTKQENLRRGHLGKNKQRWINGVKVCLSGRHEMVGDNRMPNGRWSKCRACQREYLKMYNATKRRRAAS